MTPLVLIPGMMCDSRLFGPQIARVSVPTLIACGEHDALCSPERRQPMYRLAAGSRLEIVGDAGHLPTLEQPAATSSLLADWLGRLD